MKVSILSGITVDKSSDFRTAYPINLIAVPKVTGVSEAYLKPAPGIVQTATGPGIDRGGINWNGICYRVMGDQLVNVVGATVTSLGSVGNDTKPVSMDYSFDRLAIASAGHLYYYSPSAGLLPVTDADLGLVIDVIWVDGYFMTTDGTSLVVTELNDPFAVDPLKYGSSEVDPDNIVAIKKLRDEVCAVNRYTIEVMENNGGENFPFVRNKGAMVQKGAIGTHAVCVFDGMALCFVGSGRNESLSVYLSVFGQVTNISTREIDITLQDYSDMELANIVIEQKIDTAQKQIFIHLPDKTLVYDAEASKIAGTQVWPILVSSLTPTGTYRARNLVIVNGQWLCGDPTSNAVGYLSNDISSHYGMEVMWRCHTAILYNEGRGAMLHEIELVCLTGNVAPGVVPTVGTQYSLDGETWSQERFINVGVQGQRAKRLVWFSQGYMRNWRVQRFSGTSQAYLVLSKLDIRVEPLNY